MDLGVELRLHAKVRIILQVKIKQSCRNESKGDQTKEAFEVSISKAKFVL